MHQLHDLMNTLDAPIMIVRQPPHRCISDQPCVSNILRCINQTVMFHPLQRLKWVIWQEGIEYRDTDLWQISVRKEVIFTSPTLHPCYCCNTNPKPCLCSSAPDAFAFIYLCRPMS